MPANPADARPQVTAKAKPLSPGSNYPTTKNIQTQSSGFGSFVQKFQLVRERIAPRHHRVQSDHDHDYPARRMNTEAPWNLCGHCLSTVRPRPHRITASYEPVTMALGCSWPCACTPMRVSHKASVYAYLTSFFTLSRGRDHDPVSSLSAQLCSLHTCGPPLKHQAEYASETVRPMSPLSMITVTHGEGWTRVEALAIVI